MDKQKLEYFRNLLLEQLFRQLKTCEPIRPQHSKVMTPWRMPAKCQSWTSIDLQLLRSPDVSRSSSQRLTKPWAELKMVLMASAPDAGGLVFSMIVIKRSHLFLLCVCPESSTKNLTQRSAGLHARRCVPVALYRRTDRPETSHVIELRASLEWGETFADENQRRR